MSAILFSIGLQVVYLFNSHSFLTLLHFQMVQATIMCILAIVFDLNKTDDHRRGNIVNNILLIFTVVSVVINVIISTFDFVDLKC